MEQNSKSSKISRKNIKKMNKLQSDSDTELSEDEVDQKLNKNRIKNSNLTKAEKKEIQKEKSNNSTQIKSNNNQQKRKDSNSENNNKSNNINININYKPNNEDDKDNVILKVIMKEEEEIEISENEAKEKQESESESEPESEDDSSEPKAAAAAETETDSSLQKDKYFSNINFQEFDINALTLQSLHELGFKTATEIQAKTIPLSLSGADIIGSAKTGSGKSLAFLIPAVETVLRLKEKAGTKVLVLTPTRELALQLYNLAKDLLMHHKESCALTIGGANRKVEAEKLKSGASIVIATPGRFLDHMKNTKGFVFNNLSMLVIDEADAILKIGFEQELKDIVGLLPKKRQTLLFSATMSNKLDDIIRLSLRNPIQISTKSHVATVTNLEQGYVVIDADKKFLLLYTFLRKNINKKIIVFFASCKEVEFYAHLLNYVDIKVVSTHGGQKQQKRTATFFEFSNMEEGILLCTDVVQRGLDFPDVDWIIQYDPPHNPEEYIHRVGRTARGADGKGKALLILLKYEIGLVRYLRAAKVDIKEFEFPENRLLKIQDQFEKLVNKKDHFLLTTAVDAYRSYLHSYIAHTLKDVYDINNLDLAKICKSFGLTHPPMVNLNVRIQSSSQRRKKMNNDKNFYSKGNNNKEGDKRQIVY